MEYLEEFFNAVALDVGEVLAHALLLLAFVLVHMAMFKLVRKALAMATRPLDVEL
jgi:hypothetical protein